MISINVKYVFISLVMVGLLAVTSISLSAQSIGETSRELEEKDIKENNVTFVVKPEIIFDESITFSISMNTHSVNLGFDMKEIAILHDSKGNEIFPISWAGDAEGGHHRSGYLIFPYYDDIGSFELTLSPGRKFEDLKFNWDYNS